MSEIKEEIIFTRWIMGFFILASAITYCIEIPGIRQLLIDLKEDRKQVVYSQKDMMKQWKKDIAEERVYIKNLIMPSAFKGNH